MSFKCFQDCTPKICKSLIKALQIDQRNQIHKISQKITNNKKKKLKLQIAKITQKIVSQNLAIFYVPIIKVI